MKSTIVLFLIALASSLVSAEISVNDYINWKKADIQAWHQYFPSRALTEELLTNQVAVEAATNMSTGLESSLEKVVQYQIQELMTAELMMEGTSAQGCISGISGYMDKAIQQAITNYTDCAADALPRLDRLSKSLYSAKDNYESAYQRALSGIDRCAKTYPNKDSINRLKTCVEAWNRNYFAAANSTRRDVFSSPSMVVFTSTVATCAEAAARAVVERGWTFLQMMVQCAKLSENIDAELYEDQVSTEFNSYLTSNDLRPQIWQAQSINNLQVATEEGNMLYYYGLQKQALENYAIESRGKGYYNARLFGYLSRYYYAVSLAASDNPGSSECSSTANWNLNQVLNKASEEALQCDQNIVTDAKRLFAVVNAIFLDINKALPSIGNAAILSCFNQGYVFAQNTITDCFNLTSAEFAVNVSESYRNTIDSAVNTLAVYQYTFFSSNTLPCGDSILSRAFLGADRALYDLQRCLYITSGTRYDVTVSPPPMDGYEYETTPDTPTTKGIGAIHSLVY